LSKIAIIGSGISGISAAYELKKRGHKDVVVFEKDQRIGGKCSTIDIEGKNYEMGAMVVGKVYDSILEMAKATGLTLRPMEKVELADTKKGKYLSSYEKLKTYLTEIVPLSWTVVPEFKKYQYPQSGYQKINNKELGQNFDQWLDQKKFSKYKNILASFYTTWGYGYFEDTSANYVRKLLDPDRIMRVFVKKPFNKTSMFHLNEGYQTLVEKVVDQYGIETKTGTNIHSVDRQDGKVKIKTDKGDYEFDQLILACPFHNSLQFLDAKGQEKELMSKAKVRDFHTFTCEVEKLPDIEVSFSKTDLTLDRGGYPVGWYKRYSDSNVYTFYIDNPHGYTPQKLYENMKETIERFGGEITKDLRHDQWDYFPHVPAEEIKNGFYDKMESLQGQRNTYYTGEILSFPTVEDCSSYSRDLVKKHFEIVKENKLKEEKAFVVPRVNREIGVLSAKPISKLGMRAISRDKSNAVKGSITAQEVRSKMLRIKDKESRGLSL
jgi:hypothetical protein